MLVTPSVITTDRICIEYASRQHAPASVKSAIAPLPLMVSTLSQESSQVREVLSPSAPQYPEAMMQSFNSFALIVITAIRHVAIIADNRFIGVVLFVNHFPLYMGNFS